MKKICFALTLLLCCGSAFAFDFDPIGTVKKAFGSVTGKNGSGITAGFSRDNRLEVVKDDIYRLMWQDQHLVDYEYNDKMTYDEAVKYCYHLNFAGYDDWRLPTANELLSITDDTRLKPAINKAFKLENVAYETNDKGEERYGWYWSQPKSAGDSYRAWSVDFEHGSVFQRGVSDRGFVRCVRRIDF